MTRQQTLKLLAKHNLDPQERIRLEQYLHYLTAENITTVTKNPKPKYTKKRK